MSNVFSNVLCKCQMYLAMCYVTYMIYFGSKNVHKDYLLSVAFSMVRAVVIEVLGDEDKDNPVKTYCGTISIFHSIT